MNAMNAMISALQTGMDSLKCDARLRRTLSSPLNDTTMAEALAQLRAQGATLKASVFTSEERLPMLSWCFDPEFYLQANPDVAAARLEPYLHFIEHGLVEERNPHPLIDLKHIRSQCDDLDDASSLSDSRLAELLRRPGIDPHPRFDAAFYLAHNPDVASSGMPPLEHYLRYGAAEGRVPNAEFEAWYRGTRPEADAGNDRYRAFLHFLGEAAALGQVPPVSLAVEGVFDAVRDCTAYGWAFARDQPERRIPVEILEGARVVGLGVAEHFRDDLKKSGLGDGRHAFAIRLSRRLCDGATHSLYARVQGNAEGRLHGEVVALFPAAGQDAPELLALESVPAAVERDPQLGAQLEEAAFLLETDEYESALERLRALQTRWPDNQLILLKTGEALLGAGRADEAIEAFRAAQACGSDFAAWTWLGLGDANRQLGQWQEAARCYARGHKADRQLQVLSRRIRQVEERDRMIEARRELGAGRVEQTLQLLGPLLLAHPNDERVQELVAEASDLQRGTAPPPSDPEIAKVRRSMDLLQAVVMHIQQSRETGS